MPVKYGLGDAVDYEDSNGSIHRLFVYGILLDGKYLLSRSVHHQPDCESWIPGSRLKAVPDSACETSVATLASLASDYKIRSNRTRVPSSCSGNDISEWEYHWRPWPRRWNWDRCGPYNKKEQSEHRCQVAMPYASSEDAEQLVQAAQFFGTIEGRIFHSEGKVLKLRF